MSKYIKKPIVIEAYQADKEMVIHTLEGDMLAKAGDYIVTGIRGEKYPCKKDIFEETYDRAEEVIGAQYKMTNEKWHKMSEEKPAKFGKYLCKVKRNFVYEYAIDLWCEDEGFWNWLSNCEVVAWMDVPQSDIV